MVTLGRGRSSGDFAVDEVVENLPCGSMARRLDIFHNSDNRSGLERNGSVHQPYYVRCAAPEP